MSAPATLVLAVVVALAACEPAEEQERAAPSSHPTGTALAIDGRPVARAEVDAIAERIARLRPEVTLNEHRRAALVSLLLEREAIGALLPEGRAAALRDATEELARRRAGDGTCAAVRTLGSATRLGLATWCGLIDAPVGEWRGPFEERGVTVVARRIERTDVAPASEVEALGEFVIGVEGCHWPWGEPPTPELVESALDRAHLEIVDPAYRDLVPIDLRHRLGAEAP